MWARVDFGIETKYFPNRTQVCNLHELRLLEIAQTAVQFDHALERVAPVTRAMMVRDGDLNMEELELLPSGMQADGCGGACRQGSA